MEGTIEMIPDPAKDHVLVGVRPRPLRLQENPPELIPNVTPLSESGEYRGSGNDAGAYAPNHSRRSFSTKGALETQEIPVYARNVAKGGPKLKPFQEGSCIP